MSTERETSTKGGIIAGRSRDADSVPTLLDAGQRLPPRLGSGGREQIAKDLDDAQKNAARRPITPMRSHEMRDLIARCEASLAILDEYEARDSDVDLMLGPDVLRQREWCGLRLAVRLLAAGYKHCPGYDEKE